MTWLQGDNADLTNLLGCQGIFTGMVSPHVPNYSVMVAYPEKDVRVWVFEDREQARAAMTELARCIAGGQKMITRQHVALEEEVPRVGAIK